MAEAEADDWDGWDNDAPELDPSYEGAADPSCIDCAGWGGWRDDLGRWVECSCLEWADDGD